jgi:hypothetical protein
MIEIGKNYQFQHDGNLIVNAITKENVNGSFYAKVTATIEGYKEHEEIWCDVDYFKLYEPKTTQPKQSTTKDVELRLECLKLAVGECQGKNDYVIFTRAQTYYDWITKEDKAI